MRPHSLLIVSMLLALVTALAPASECSAQDPQASPLIRRIDTLAAEELGRRGAVGLSVAVAQADDIMLSKGYGSIDLEHGVATSETSLFRIASVTKQFTAAAILRLVEQGKISLDDDFTKYVDFPTPGKTVTIRHLLTHTSGLKNYTDMPDFFEKIAGRDLSPAQVLDLVRNLPLDFDPGTKWAYSNTGYHLLGMIIERVSGIAYAKYLQQEFFAPLRLNETRYDVSSDVIPGRARGYGVVRGTPANASYLSMTIPYSAGGLLSTAGDLVRWNIALRDGKVVSPASYAQMTTPAALSDGASTRYGFGLFLSEVDGHPNVMHEGGIPGFNCILVHFPKDDLTIAVISNSPGASSGRLAAEIARAVFSAQLPR